MMNQDGVSNGYDLERLTQVRERCYILLIAFGGARAIAHFGDKGSGNQILLTEQQRQQLDWQKRLALTNHPQHAVSGDVLILGYMNVDAPQTSKQSRQVTFYSRSK